jgi:hypothetical protein
MRPTSEHVSPDMVAKKIPCGPSADRHLEAIGQFIKAGSDHIILVQVGADQDYFFDFFKRELAPSLRAKKSAYVLGPRFSANRRRRQR